MSGLLAASILCGRAISRIGRYKPFPIAGTAITTVGLFLLSRLEVDTPPWLASVYMLVVGIGIGLVMQVLVLAVQNCAPPKDIGVATSDRDVLPLDGRLARRRAVRRDLRLAPGRRAVAPPAADRRALRRRREHLARTQVHALPAGDPQHDFLSAFVHALSPTFLVGAALTLVAFGLSFALKEMPLRGANRQPPSSPPRRRSRAAPAPRRWSPSGAHSE